MREERWRRQPRGRRRESQGLAGCKYTVVERNRGEFVYGLIDACLLRSTDMRKFYLSSRAHV